MLKLFEKTPSLLLPGHVVKFETAKPGDNFSPNIKDGEYYRVVNTVQVPYKIAVILPGTDATELDMSNEASTSINLYPTSTRTLYEILLGFEGDNTMYIYPEIPAGKYLLRLEESTMHPPTDLTTLTEKYTLGAITPQDSPVDEPKLRIHTVKDMEPLYFRILNADLDYKKMPIYFLVNKCKIERLTPEEAKAVETYRLIQKYDMYY